MNQSSEKNISILVEIPEHLHKLLSQYLETHPHWNQDQVFIASLSVFLMHTSKENITQIDSSKINQACLDALFKQ
ncbi:DUF2811 domain-containing protein [Leptolyngbya sp. AN03gr2]|uniref:DUF2811 domain-containing protein n=1 Tax=unclassified Leptolyngbya TaxID=2650499 RepID=UPI003D311B24